MYYKYANVITLLQIYTFVPCCFDRKNRNAECDCVNESLLHPFECVQSIQVQRSQVTKLIEFICNSYSLILNCFRVWFLVILHRGQYTMSLRVRTMSNFLSNFYGIPVPSLSFKFIVQNLIGVLSFLFMLVSLFCVPSLMWDLICHHVHSLRTTRIGGTVTTSGCPAHQRTSTLLRIRSVNLKGKLQIFSIFFHLICLGGGGGVQVG